MGFLTMGMTVGFLDHIANEKAPTVRCAASISPFHPQSTIILSKA
jgi:hypothetical protein